MSELLLELSARAKALLPEERALASYERGESTTYAAEDVFAEARRLAK